MIRSPLLRQSTTEKTRILFVCLGNICRSPLAEGILRHLADEKGLSARIETDSAGTGGWHQGDPPDPRSIAIGREHGLDISALRARKLRMTDFSHFDMIFAMDRSNLRDIIDQAPHDSSADIHLFMDFVGGSVRDVPDPYYGDRDDFRRVHDMLLAGCTRLVSILHDADPHG